jgi:hypothetical protein
MYVKDGITLRDYGFSLGEGEDRVSFPPRWLSRATAEDLERYGIEFVPDPEPEPLPEPPPPPPPTPEEIQARLTMAIQRRLDEFAQTRNYDGILSACTYATSAIQKFRDEGQYAVEARDATWARAYEILAEVTAGEREIPGAQELFSLLPHLEWPGEKEEEPEDEPEEIGESETTGEPEE